MAAIGAIHVTAQREVLVEVLASGRPLAPIQIVQNPLMGAEVYQPLMLAFAHRHAPCGRFDVARIDDLAQQPRNRHRAQSAVRQVFREVRIVFQKALHLGLRGEAPAGKSFQRLTHDGSQGIIQNQNLAAMPFAGDILIADRGAEHPIAAFDTSFHLLDDLTAVLFTLQFALGGKHGFDELAFRRILEPEIRRLHRRPTLGKLTAQLNVILRIPCQTLEIIEDDCVALARLGIHIGEHRPHTGALHVIAAARHIIRKDHFHVKAALSGIGAAAVFL